MVAIVEEGPLRFAAGDEDVAGDVADEPEAVRGSEQTVGSDGNRVSERMEYRCSRRPMRN